MHALKKIRWLGEAFFLLLGFVLIPILPRVLVLGLANLLGALGYGLSGKLRRIAHANLDVAYGDDLSPERKSEIVRSSFKTFALVTLDLFWFSLFTGRRIRKYVDVDPSFQQLYFDRPGPFVFIAAHLGNWEIMGQIATLSGDPISSVAKPLKNRFADVVVNRLRRSTGQVIQQSSGALRELLRVLKAGGKVGLVMDQNTRVESGGLFVNFWGLPVPVSKAPAFLALQTKGNVSIGYCLPQEKGRYRIYMDALPSFEKVTVEEGTALILAEIEKVIRKYPGQWLWMYKRWKHVPEGDDGARYPFYKRM